MTPRRIVFLTHAEVVIDPAVPVPDWGLSALGRDRHAHFALDPVLDGVTAVYSSAERKAVEGAEIAASRRGLVHRTVAALGENDRSATGYLPSDEFERTADRFFAFPDDSVRGWERARAAQARVVAATLTIAELDGTRGALLIVAHGAVGALLRCHLKDREITREEAQSPGGGCWFAFDAPTGQPGAWKRI